jgi:L-iditol 2-dehydrogenase
MKSAAAGKPNLCDTLRFLGITPGYPGGFAEYMPLNGEILSCGIVHEIPDSLSTTEAALAEPCSSVLATQEVAGAGLADTVVILGAGPIGCIHIAVSKARGAFVIITEPSEVRRDLAQAFLPDIAVDPATQDLKKIVAEKTDGRGADIVICANPVAATQSLAVDIVRKAGDVYLFGGLPKVNPLTTMDGNRIHYGEIRVIGAFSYHPRMHALALDLLARGVIPADSLITRIVDLKDIETAFEAAAGGETLKVIVKV